MRKVAAYALLQLACWIGRIGFRVSGVDMRESQVVLQIVPTPERLKREADEREAYWAGVFQELRRKTESSAEAVTTSAFDRGRSKSSRESN